MNLKKSIGTTGLKPRKFNQSILHAYTENFELGTTWALMYKVKSLEILHAFLRSCRKIGLDEDLIKYVLKRGVILSNSQHKGTKLISLCFQYIYKSSW